MSSARRRGPTSDEVEVLYRLVGKAVWHLQHLEDAISAAITLKSDFKDAKAGTVPAEEALRMRAKRQRMTLGQAVEHAKRTALFSEELFSALETLLRERNWLIHRSVLESADSMNLDGAREALFERIAHVEELSHALQRLIGEDLMAFMVGKGLSAERITATAEAQVLKAHGEL